MLWSPFEGRKRVAGRRRSHVKSPEVDFQNTQHWARVRVIEWALVKLTKQGTPGADSPLRIRQAPLFLLEKFRLVRPQWGRACCPGNPDSKHLVKLQGSVGPNAGLPRMIPMVITSNHSDDAVAWLQPISTKFIERRMMVSRHRIY